LLILPALVSIRKTIEEKLMVLSRYYFNIQGILTNTPRKASLLLNGDTILYDDAMPTTANLYLQGTPLLASGSYSLLGLGVIVDTTSNTGASLLDLGACFSASQNYTFNMNNTNCLYNWKTAQYNRYGLQLFNYTPPVVPVVCNVKCSNVGRNTSTALVTYDLTTSAGVSKGFFKAISNLNISSSVGAGNLDSVATSGAYMSFAFNALTMITIGAAVIL